MEIITTPDPRVREPSENVSTIDDAVRETIEAMRKLSLDWEKDHPYELSAAMAAPQIGVNQRIIIIRDDLEDKKHATFTALINPEIIREDGRKITDFEGCLSVPFVYAKVPRSHRVKVKALNEDGQPVRIKASGELARTLLHEVDHLNGLLFIDRVKGKKDAFYEMDDQGNLQPLDYDTKIKGNQDLFPDD